MVTRSVGPWSTGISVSFSTAAFQAGILAGTGISGMCTHGQHVLTLCSKHGFCAENRKNGFSGKRTLHEMPALWVLPEMPWVPEMPYMLSVLTVCRP